jgi:hypothetical protein
MTPIRVVLLALLVGCGGGSGLKYTLTPTTPAPASPAQPLAANCDFEVFKEAPQGEYDLLAEVKPVDFGATTSDEFKDAIRAEVCKAGGEMVVATINGANSYIKGVVFRKHRIIVPAPGTPPATPPAPAQ